MYKNGKARTMKKTSIILLNYNTCKLTKLCIESIRCYTRPGSYEIIVIDYDPDNEYVSKILALPYCEHDRHYASDNLHHDVFTLYY